MLVKEKSNSENKYIDRIFLNFVSSQATTYVVVDLVDFDVRRKTMWVLAKEDVYRKEATALVNIEVRKSYRKLSRS